VSLAFQTALNLNYALRGSSKEGVEDLHMGKREKRERERGKQVPEEDAGGRGRKGGGWSDTLSWSDWKTGDQGDGAETNHRNGWMRGWGVIIRCVCVCLSFFVCVCVCV
jgi:hypothetical protein